MKRAWLRLSCFLLALSMAGAALADGVIRDGLGAASIGRGGTNIAFADNGEVLYDNPAGMINLDSRGLFDVGFDLLLTDLHYSDPHNNSANDDSVFPLAQASLIRKSRNGVWAYGVGLFVPAGFATTYDLQGPFPLLGPRRYKSIGALAKVLPGIACRVTDRLSVGATLGVAVSHMELEGPYFLQGPNMLRGLPTALDLQSTGAALTWSVGLQYQLTEATTLGLTYLSESRFHMDGNTLVTVPLVGQARYQSTLDATWPRSLGLGVRHELSPCRIVSADVIWYNWSNAFDHFGLHLNKPNNVMFPPIYDQFPLNWRDSVSVRLGYERHFNSGSAIRLGYVYHRNPIPDGTLSPYIQATLEHSVCVGYSCMLRRWRLDLAYQFCFGPEHYVSKSDFIGGDFDQSHHRAQAHFISMSLTRPF